MRLHIPDQNQLTLRGNVVRLPEPSHYIQENTFYQMTVASMRMSGYIDMIPVLLDGKLAALDYIQTDREIEIRGSLRSHNERTPERNKLIITVLANEILPAEPGGEQTNTISISGSICKQPIYRRTPLGREICDIMLAVCRRYGRADYLPCIVWGRNAQTASEFSVGERISGEGRIQSREYNKIIDGVETVKTAFEVSLSNISRVAE